MNEDIIGEIKSRLENAKKVVVASHVRPDGDAIGSLLGLGLALQNAGKSVQMVLVDGVSSSFRHLEGSELIVKEPKGEHDTFITVDCADFKRVLYRVAYIPCRSFSEAGGGSVLTKTEKFRRVGALYS